MKKLYRKFLISLLIFTTLFTQVGTGIVYAQTSYTYDANGNVTSDGEECYTYNDLNKISEVRDCGTNALIAEYVYDHSGERGLKKVYENGVLTDTIYTVGDHYETKIASDSARTDTTYYRVNNELVSRKNSDGSRVYYHNDHLQSTSVVTDESGNLVERTEYEPYGEIVAGGTEGKYQYTGQELDNETNLAYYNARYYDPSLKRFIQPDSILPDPYDPQQLNRYAYVRNNPLKYTDPSGHLGFEINLGGISNLVFGPGLDLNLSVDLSTPIEPGWGAELVLAPKVAVEPGAGADGNIGATAWIEGNEIKAISPSLLRESPVQMQSGGVAIAGLGGRLGFMNGDNKLGVTGEFAFGPKAALPGPYVQFGYDDFVIAGFNTDYGLKLLQQTGNREIVAEIMSEAYGIGKEAISAYFEMVKEVKEEEYED